MDLAHVSLLASVVGFVVFTILCLSVSLQGLPSRTRWPLVAGLVTMVALGSLTSFALLVASRHGVRSVWGGEAMLGTASSARALGFAALVASLTGAALLATALLIRRPRFGTVALASAAGALFVLSVASGWWAVVERGAG